MDKITELKRIEKGIKSAKYTIVTLKEKIKIIKEQIEEKSSPRLDYLRVELKDLCLKLEQKEEELEELKIEKVLIQKGYVIPKATEEIKEEFEINKEEIEDMLNNMMASHDWRKDFANMEITTANQMREIRDFITLTLEDFFENEIDALEE